jgi:hypothetical protein
MCLRMCKLDAKEILEERRPFSLCSIPPHAGGLILDESNSFRGSGITSFPRRKSPTYAVAVKRVGLRRRTRTAGSPQVQRVGWD